MRKLIATLSAILALGATASEAAAASWTSSAPTLSHATPYKGV